MTTLLGTTYSIFEEVAPRPGTIVLNTDMEILDTKFNERKYEEYIRKEPHSNGALPKSTPYCGARSITKPSLCKRKTKEVDQVTSNGNLSTTYGAKHAHGNDSRNNTFNLS